MSQPPEPPSLYQLRITLREISPLIWRRLLVCSDTTLAQLHEGKVHYDIDVPRAAPTMRGFAGLLHAGLNGATPTAIAATPDDLCQQLGLQKALGSLRVRGLTALLTRMKRHARDLAL